MMRLVTMRAFAGAVRQGARVQARPWARAGAVTAGIAGATALAAPLYLDAPPSTERLVQDKATSMALPAEMAAGKHTLRLVGLGVRTVTFIGIHVYVAGVYVEEGALAESMRTLAPPADLEAQFAEWLERGVPCAVRIMPVRSTDFNHLRDGLVRAINVRAKDARKENSPYLLTGDAESVLASNLRDLKALFPKSSVQKGKMLDLIVQRTGNAYTLTLQFDQAPLGAVVSDVPASVATRPFAMPMHLLLAYVGVRPDISAPLRASLADHLHSSLP